MLSPHEYISILLKSRILYQMQKKSCIGNQNCLMRNSARNVEHFVCSNPLSGTLWTLNLMRTEPLSVVHDI